MLIIYVACKRKGRIRKKRRSSEPRGRKFAAFHKELVNHKESSAKLAAKIGLADPGRRRALKHRQRGSICGLRLSAGTVSRCAHAQECWVRNKIGESSTVRLGVRGREAGRDRRAPRRGSGGRWRNSPPQEAPCPDVRRDPPSSPPCGPGFRTFAVGAPLYAAVRASIPSLPRSTRSSLGSTATPVSTAPLIFSPDPDPDPALLPVNALGPRASSSGRVYWARRRPSRREWSPGLRRRIASPGT